MHRLSPTHNPTGTAAELQNPPGMEEAVSTTNMISWGDSACFPHIGQGELSWGTAFNWVISAAGPNRHKSCQPCPPMLMLPMPA